LFLCFPNMKNWKVLGIGKISVRYVALSLFPWTSSSASSRILDLHSNIISLPPILGEGFRSKINPPKSAKIDHFWAKSSEIIYQKFNCASFGRYWMSFSKIGGRGTTVWILVPIFDKKKGQQNWYLVNRNMWTSTMRIHNFHCKG
jgi:hypothetical protein